MGKIKSTDSNPHITTLESLYQHLQWAIEVELSTIPPYLCALYSIPEDSKNKVAVELIQSVVMEEMLHMTLAANILNAVGGRPVLNHRDFIPEYPSHMPHSGTHFKISLLPFSPAAIETFLKIEKPEKMNAPARADHYHTIAQLYDAIADGLEYLSKTLGHDTLFSGDIKKQVTNEHYYGGGGKVIIVKNLEKALEAVEEVKEQGEGLIKKSIWDGDEKYGQSPELAHFYRFNEICEGKYYLPGDTAESGPSGSEFKIYWDEVYNMQPNPKMSHYNKGTEIRNKMESFNRSYTSLLFLLHDAFNGDPHLLLNAVEIMYELKYKAIELMRIPSGKGNLTVGPSFEFFIDLIN